MKLGLTKPGEVGDFIPLVSKKSLSKWSCSALSVFEVSIFFKNTTFFLPYSQISSFHVSKIWPFQGLMFNILFQTYLIASFFKSVEKDVCFVKNREHVAIGKETFKSLQDIRMSPRFSLTLPLGKLKEKSCCPVLTKCGEPCEILQLFIQINNYTITNHVGTLKFRWDCVWTFKIILFF